MTSADEAAGSNAAMSLLAFSVAMHRKTDVVKVENPSAEARAAEIAARRFPRPRNPQTTAVVMASRHPQQ